MRQRPIRSSLGVRISNDTPDLSLYSSAFWRSTRRRANRARSLMRRHRSSRPPPSGTKALDVDAAIKLLCKGAHLDACRILEVFRTATMASDSPTAGKDLWVGESFPLSGTAADHETNFLQLTPGATPNADGCFAVAKSTESDEGKQSNRVYADRRAYVREENDDTRGRLGGDNRRSNLRLYLLSEVGRSAARSVSITASRSFVSHSLRFVRTRQSGWRAACQTPRGRMPSARRWRSSGAERVTAWVRARGGPSARS